MTRSDRIQRGGQRPRTLLLSAVAGLGLASCSGPAFMNLDPWPGSVREQQSDAWLSGGRYGRGAVVSSDVPAYVADDEDASAQSAAAPTNQAPKMGGLEPAPKDEEPLLAWDGDVVDGPARGSVTERNDPTSGIERTPGSRTYLLQLYQDVLDERDHMEDEVRALRKALGDAQMKLDDSSASTTGLAARLDALDAEVERLAAENEDLTARLATSQIRRLEAEKLLLETRIGWYRAQQAAAIDAASSEPAAQGGAASGSGLQPASRGGRRP